MTKFRKALMVLSVAAAAAVGNSAAKAGVIAGWTFESDALAVNNNPVADTGSGTASSIGMDVYPTPNVGVTTDDVLQGVTGDSAAGAITDVTQIWRVRAQAAPGGGAANGWSSLAPVGTQGAIFSASTAGFNAINVSFDWYATNQGEANMQLEYTTDGTHFTNIPVTLPLTDPGATVVTNSGSDPNSVVGSYVHITGGGQAWFPGLTATITDPAAVNDPNFAIEMVNASTGAADVSAKGTALNNSSGNWRFDNVSINGTSVPEPTSIAVLGLTGLGLLSRRRAAK